MNITDLETVNRTKARIDYLVAAKVEITAKQFAVTMLKDGQGLIGSYIDVCVDPIKAQIDRELVVLGAQMSALGVDMNVETP